MKSPANSDTFRNSISRFDISSLEKAKNNWDRVRKLVNIQRVITCAHDIAFERRKKFKHITVNEKLTAYHIFQMSLRSNVLKSLFDLLASLINLYLAFAIPYRLALFTDHEISLLYIHDLVLDSVLFIHYIIKIIDPISEISYMHEFSLKHSFIYPFIRIRMYTDFLSIIPLYMVTNRLYWLKICRIFRVVSIFNWLNYSIIAKQMKNMKFFSKYYEVYEAIIYTLRLTTLVMITCHCIACLWYYIPTNLKEKNENTWLGPDWEIYSRADNYMRSLYWTAVTFSSVGYGDITGKTTQEYFYSMFVEFLGIIFFAYLMGSLTNKIRDYYLIKDQVRFRDIELNNWLIYVEENIKDKKKHEEIEGKIVNYFHQKWMCNPKSLNNFEDYMMMMPQNLLKQLFDDLFGTRIKIFDVFFKIIPDSIKFEVSASMHSEIIQKNIEVIKENTKNTNIYFIVAGSVASGIKSIGYATMLNSGSYFGEDSAIFQDESFLSFVSRETTCLLYLNWPHLFKIFKNNNLDIIPYAKTAFKRAKYFYETSKFKYTSEFYITDVEMFEFAGRFNLKDPNLNYSEQEEFDVRAENLMKKLEKHFDLKNPEKIMQKFERSSEIVTDEVGSVCNDFNEGLQNLLKKVKILEKLGK